MKASQYKSEPGRHTGLGMASYAQATSPLRRYTDLLVHQQLRAHLNGTAPLDGNAHGTTGRASQSMRGVRTAERLSNRHWTLVALRRQPNWHGEGIVVERNGNRNLVVLPALDLETEIYGRGELPIDTPLTVKLVSVDLPQLESRFQVV
ncbi:MAG: RNB domain-containing ribonuclease [Caldilineaceae bacterium]